MKQLVLASNNPGKLREFGALLATVDFAVLPQSCFNVPEVEEPHCTFIENALVKARHAAHLTGLASLADDSGLCVDALRGAPGVLSARYAGEPRSDIRNNEKLIADLVGQAGRNAHYYCALVFVRYADDPQPIIAEGEWYGSIIDMPRGENGFGYDPHFWLSDFACTAAELAVDRKNAVSHRGRALTALIARLKTGDR
jgi:XTP/dITP diphosphohydrolase